MNAKTIISLLAIARIFLAASVFAGDTDPIPSLTIAGQTYTNVELGSVTGSRVTIFFDGGGERVAISNLPAYLQKRLNYDPEAARAQDAAEAERIAAAKERADKNAEALAAAQAALGPAQKIRLMKILPDTHVQIEAEGVLSEAYIHNLPPEILTLLRDFQTAEANVTNLQNQLALAKPASAQGGYHGRLSRQAAENQASAATANASYRSNLETSLASAKKSFDAIKSQLSARSTITARPCAFFLYPHARAWEYESGSVPAVAKKMKPTL
jgi:hypothetical protein